ncbi:hypothetical protein SARC_11146 [Sphaeroforma arctica JP610]|uniref:Uncharacterized protein n=1 Tax=Sphaeroforma arctica JP610 TaxID=667725 RepID=A0A0L0FHV8_9EUKA|nr:hypothetical protein SARC_11146 [Sphaeroforma arctica JP610]KNC76345.1 hypothetical protein SARC_11146 [Sphaeroforma arctica JP610]|eukprot:XP_014150247.1 hypothetical protein SARC_11146 [Sphaeroforma arctica JP610]
MILSLRQVKLGTAVHGRPEAIDAVDSITVNTGVAYGFPAGFLKECLRAGEAACVVAVKHLPVGKVDAFCYRKVANNIRLIVRLGHLAGRRSFKTVRRSRGPCAAEGLKPLSDVTG